jgi:signal transduction histidine kinase
MNTRVVGELPHNPLSLRALRIPTIPEWARRVLAVPLIRKLAGANALLVVAASLALIVTYDDGVSGMTLAAVTGLAFLAGLIVNLVLVRLALLPLRDLESTVSQVSNGNLAARVPESLLADTEMQRIGQTINELLDRLIAERTRVRQLATQLIQASERERSRIALELHDSTAQMLAALTMQASAALRSATTPELQTQLELIRDHAVEALEAVRTLSHTMHPRVLDDLGIAAALEWMARRMREGQSADVEVEVIGDAKVIPRAIGSVLYHVAQEALTNAARHAECRSVRIVLAVAGNSTRLQVVDDGRGFDLPEAKRRRPGMGLFAMAERVALVDGALQIDTAPGRGTRITATIPLHYRGEMPDTESAFSVASHSASPTDRGALPS